MTNNIKMMKSINGSLYERLNERLYEGLSAKAAGPVSMISMLAISVGLAAAPAHAQDITVPAMIAPVQPVQSVQASPVISPQPEPTAPSASNPAAAKTATTPPETQSRADDLASKGGFDAETVAPEALAQIEREQQARKAAAATAAAAPVKASGSRANGSSASNISADSNADSMIASDAPAAAPTFEAETAAGTVAAIPAVQPAPEVVSPPNSLSGETGADFGLLAALAALLGVGGAGAYAAARRRKGKGQAAPVVPPVVHGNDPLPASLNAAIMPELRRNQVEPEARPMVDTDQTAVQTLESKATTKADFAQFVANLPSFDKPLGKADRSVSLGQRRVAAAPRPYLAEADLSRTAGYFTANVDAMPTPQNPFLTREKRLKRARFLDGKLASTKAPNSKSPTRVTGEMQVSRPLEPAFS
ncbi:hypothetical protein [Parasphingorhabdus sp.]|uniref:hypothetical protein n=1 Tax=Parasphingorhabdus sp. TaxID=2709688 RepID=UPI002B26C0EA|nr:hypothetical protein [Parasphingorhabdus sp.]